MSTDLEHATVAVIGGTGLYTWLADAPDVVTVEIPTPFGEPSAPITLATIAQHRVAFLPRHGVRHEFAAHAINYRANIWALRSLGVTQILASCAVGGLQPDRTPRGALVVPSQLLNRTSGRAQTFTVTGATHVPFADPYCPRLRDAISRAGQQLGEPINDQATMVVIDGPAFSTRAESLWYASQGWDLVNMTGQPEAVLAREMQICYASLTLVTDLDAGVNPGEGVSEREVLRTFTTNLPRVRAVLSQAITSLPDPAGCVCARWADGHEVAFANPAPRNTWQTLQPTVAAR